MRPVGGLRRVAALAGLCGLSVLTMGLHAACGGSALPAPSPAASSAAVVVVDGDPITEADIDAIRAELRLAGADDGQAAAREQAVRRFLVRREAERRGVVVSDRDVAARLKEVRANAGGAESLNAALDAAGMTKADLEVAVRYSLLERALQDALFPERAATVSAVRAFYREHRDTLFTAPAQLKLRRLTVPTEKLAREAAAEVSKGATFASVAQHYSMDATTRFKGGMLGWVVVASLPKKVAVALGGLGRGAVSEPIYSFGRWHVYKVVGRRSAETAPLAEVRDEVAAELTRRLRAEALDDWVRDELERAVVKSAS